MELNALAEENIPLTKFKIYTSPDLEPSQLELEEGPLSGYGYELMMLAKQGDMEVVKEFISWVKYIDDIGNHIYQG